jgi:hypothetical protein
MLNYQRVNVNPSLGLFLGFFLWSKWSINIHHAELQTCLEMGNNSKDRSIAYLVFYSTHLFLVEGMPEMGKNGWFMLTDIKAKGSTILIFGPPHMIPQSPTISHINITGYDPISSNFNVGHVGRKNAQNNPKHISESLNHQRNDIKIHFAD